MPEVHIALAEQFEEMPQQKSAATLGMWTFLATEILFFGGLFMAYIVYRHAYPDAWMQSSNQLNTIMGGANTLVLICSSVTMVLAVRAAQVGSRNGQIVNLILTILFGATFLVVKYFEYSAKFHHGLLPSKNTFLAIYFTLTGLHGLHVIGGMAINAYLLGPGSKLWKTDPEHFTNRVENSGLFWHFVDLVWIFLFPILYLL